MILSHRHRFIFVKTRKTAGTSIEAFLSQACGPDDVVTPVRPPVAGHEPRNHKGLWNPFDDVTGPGRTSARSAAIRLMRRERFFNHMPARLVRERVGQAVWEEYLTFCVERNPWDKTLSHFAMVRDRTGGTLTLDEYLAAGDLCSDFDRYATGDGRLLVDRVVAYEDLATGLAEVFDRLGIPFDGSLGVEAKAQHRTDRRPYREVFTPGQRDVVARAFAREIDLFGYRF